jgi:hypothetical protein
MGEVCVALKLVGGVWSLSDKEILHKLISADQISGAISF